MRNIWAIARLTVREGVRMRIVLVFLVVLGFVMLRLPFTVRGDETVAGQLQTFLSYSLGAVSLLLGLATVFLSCATLTGDIRSMTIHLVVTKPISRFQVLVGKWVGVNVLLLALLVLCTVTVYAFASLIKNRPVEFARDEAVVRDVVWQARVASRPVRPPELEAEAREWVRSEARQGRLFARGEDFAVAERIKELDKEWRMVPPAQYRAYKFANLIPPRDPQARIQVRYRCRANPMTLDEMVPVSFAFADPTTNTIIGSIFTTSEHANDWHQFLAHAQGVIKNGEVALVVINPLDASRRNAIYFDQDRWLELLYTIGTFEENYVKTVLILAGRLAVLSAVALFFSTFVSFPVACFCVLTFYVICLGMPFWLEAIGANMEYQLASIDPYGRFGPAVRTLLVPAMKLLFPDFGHYDGTQHLIAGEYIPYGLLLRSLAHTLCYGVVLLFLPGWLVFRRREIAEAAT